MKKTITILFIVLVFTCAAIYAFRLKKREEKSPEQPNPTVQKKTTDDGTEETTISQEGLGPQDYRAIIDDSQLKSMNEMITHNTNSGCTYQFQITSAQKSRILREDFKEGAIGFSSSFPSKKEFFGELMSESGDFVHDFYYLYVDIEVYNIGIEDASFTPLDFKYLQIDKDNVATAIDLYPYKGEEFFDNSPYYLLETDGKDMINYMMVIMPFKSNDSCKYTMCYIVLDEMMEDNNIYVYRTNGLHGKDLLMNKDIQYVKLDTQ